MKLHERLLQLLGRRDYVPLNRNEIGAKLGLKKPEFRKLDSELQQLLSRGAIVRVNGGRTMVLKSTPANSGQIYENRTGARLARNGNDVTWNTALRSAPESCRVVYTPM